MNWIVMKYVVLFFGLFIYLDASFGKSSKEIFKENNPSVVQIRCNDSSGTGFYIAEDIILTNLHVAKAKEECKIVMHDGKIYIVNIRENLLFKSIKSDTAYFKVNISSRPIKRSVLQVSPGERIYTIGYPNGFGPAFQEGIVNRVFDMDASTLQVSSPTQPGSSGSPILNDESELVGIIHSIYPGSDSFAFGTGIKDINLGLSRAINHNFFLQKHMNDCKSGDKAICRDVAFNMFSNSLYEESLELSISLCRRSKMGAACFLTGMNYLTGDRLNILEGLNFFKEGCRLGHSEACKAEDGISFEIGKRGEVEIVDSFFLNSSRGLFLLPRQILDISDDSIIRDIFDEDAPEAILLYTGKRATVEAIKVILYVGDVSVSEIEKIRNTGLFDYAENLKNKIKSYSGYDFKLVSSGGFVDPYFVFFSEFENAKGCAIEMYRYSDKLKYIRVVLHVEDCKDMEEMATVLKDSIYTKNNSIVFNITSIYNYLSWLVAFVLISLFFLIHKICRSGNSFSSHNLQESPLVGGIKQFAIASKWQRFAAFGIDILLLALIIFCIIFLSSSFGVLSQLLVDFEKEFQFIIKLASLVFYFCCLTYFYGATPGKYLAGIRVVGEDGVRLNASKILIRELLGKISAPFILGHLWIFFNPKNKNSWDYIAKTVVIRVIPSKGMSENTVLYINKSSAGGEL